MTTIVLMCSFRLSELVGEKLHSTINLTMKPRMGCLGLEIRCRTFDHFPASYCSLPTGLRSGRHRVETDRIVDQHLDRRLGLIPRVRSNRGLRRSSNHIAALTAAGCLGTQPWRSARPLTAGGLWGNPEPNLFDATINVLESEVCWAQSRPRPATPCCATGST